MLHEPPLKAFAFLVDLLLYRVLVKPFLEVLGLEQVGDASLEHGVAQKVQLAVALLGH